MMNSNPSLEIICFEEKYTKDFKRLNLEWLEGYNLLEPADLKYLDNPLELILQPGGRIIMAMMGREVVGTCAVIVKDEKSVELAKLAVSKTAQGKGIGRALALESISQAKEMGAQTIVLVSNSQLSAAMGLYESLGFKHAPLPEDTDYETADVYMEFDCIPIPHN